jgi:hypothetical protein
MNIPWTTPMTRCWFRDSIGTVYAWDYENRYFYMFVDHVRDPYWCAISKSRMEAILKGAA